MAVLQGGARGCVHHPDARKVYFFAGDRYWRYDLGRDYGEVRYPGKMEAWNLPEPFASGIDAAVDGFGQLERRMLFFKGDRYLRYRWDDNQVEEGPSPIAELGLTMGAFASGIDAAINGRGPYQGYAYFFRGDLYVRFNWGTKQVDGQPTSIAAWNLGPGFEGGIVACAETTTPLGMRPKAHFFKGDRYVRYDWDNDRADAGYPRPVDAGWPSGLAVWAEHGSAPLRGCADASLEGGEDRIRGYPSGTARGQAGWQLGVRFADPAGLAESLEKAVIPSFCGDDDAGRGTVPPAAITRLGLVARGAPGVLDTARVGGAEGRLAPATVGAPPLRAALERVGAMLAPGAPVVLLGGDCARGPDGGKLLEALSEVWPGHPVTGFTRLCYAHSGRQQRPAQPCTNPGVRLTERAQPFSADPATEQREADGEFSPDWGDLGKLPWAHEGLVEHRKTALDGQIVHAGAPE